MTNPTINWIKRVTIFGREMNETATNPHNRASILKKIPKSKEMIVNTVLTIANARVMLEQPWH